MLKHLIHKKINEVFLAYQEANNITDGGIDPFDALQLEQIEESLCELVERVGNYQKRGSYTMKPGDLIAVSGDLYEYEGIEQAEYTRGIKMHRVYEVDIDEDGNLTNTYNPWYFTDKELTKGNKPNFTEKQWCGIVETLIRNDYDLTEEEIETAAEDIVCREFAILGVPTVEELNRRIETYMNR